MVSSNLSALARCPPSSGAKAAPSCAEHQAEVDEVGVEVRRVLDLGGRCPEDRPEGFEERSSLAADLSDPVVEPAGGVDRRDVRAVARRLPLDRGEVEEGDVAEVVEHRPPCDTRSRRDLPGARLQVALREQLDERVEDGVAGPRSPHAAPILRGSRRTGCVPRPLRGRGTPTGSGPSSPHAAGC